MAWRDDDAQRNRQRFPQTAALVAEFKSVFGEGVKLICVSENGHEAGSAGDLEHMREVLAHARTHAREREHGTQTCTCSACVPNKTRQKQMQRAPGADFGLTSNRKFKQRTTYRMDLFSDEYWRVVSDRLRNGRKPLNDESEDSNVD